MNRNCLIRQAVRYAIAAAAVSTALPALAQEAATPNPELTEITVVGTRIAKKDYEATSPVVTVSEDTFRLSGEPQIEQVLNTLPQLVPSITTTSNNPSNGGQANVDLRGLGTVRTLVLVDGARVTPSNVNGVVDLNTIPAALIESVEILTGGSSATYGSDAIAGVVNVKLKRTFNGIEIRAQQGMTAEGDGESTVFDGVVGGNFGDDRGNAVVSFSYDRRDAVLAGARDFGIYAKGPLLTPSGSGTIPEGRIDWGSNAPSQPALNAVFSPRYSEPGSRHRFQRRQLDVLDGWWRTDGSELPGRHRKSGLQPECLQLQLRSAQLPAASSDAQTDLRICALRDGAGGCRAVHATELHHLQLRSAAGGDARDLLGSRAGLLDAGEQRGDHTSAQSLAGLARCEPHGADYHGTGSAVPVHQAIHRHRRAHPGEQLRRRAGHHRRERQAAE